MAIHKAHARETTLRHLWLAGLGLVSLLRTSAVATRARMPAAGVARGRIRDAIALLDEGIGTRLAPLVRALALRPRATAAVERGGATEGSEPGASAGRAGQVRRRTRVTRVAPTPRPRQSR